ncbi:MAG: putative rane protein [Herbinix sp.]|jgi:two-component system sensor histidine kinase YesM|nr:putative rane protein [Herbinix sp.]
MREGRRKVGISNRKKNTKIRGFYNRLRLSQKILFSFVFAAIIPLIIIQLFFYKFNAEYINDKVNQLMVNNLSQTVDRVNLSIDVYTNILYQIYVDDEIINNVRIMSDDKEIKKAVAYNNINNRLKQYISAVDGIRCLSIICNDGQTVTYDLKTGSSIDNIWRDYDDLRDTQPFLNAKDKAGMAITPTMKIDDKGEDVYVFHISKQIFNFNHLEDGAIATAVMTIDERVLDSLCNVDEGNEGALEYSFTFILDKDKNVIAYPEQIFAGLKLDPNIGIERFVTVTGLLKNKKIAINSFQDDATGWSFYNVFDLDYMLKDIKHSQKIFSLSGAITLLFSSILIVYTIKKIVESVNKIIKGIQLVKTGDFDTVVIVETQDEIGEIANHFNEMTKEVKQLIFQVMEATQLQKDAEIKALEAQINPHFLYNTLDTINWMAIEKEEYAISTMLRNLGVILRYSINESNKEVPIWQEKDWLEKYISLYRMRYNDGFECICNIDSTIQNVKIHKLILQPFVENSILHGFKGMEQGGMIRIDAMRVEGEDSISILIEDNGKGMTSEVVQLYNNRDTAIIDDGRSIGMHNAFSRIDMYYGKAAKWGISSVEGMGTVITLKLPIVDWGSIDENRNS